MKASLAAFVMAIEAFVAARPRCARLDRAADHLRRGRPGASTAPCASSSGSRRAARRIDYCIVGEPSSVGAAGRHDQERPPRHAVGHADREGRPGARRLSAPRAQSDPRSPRPRSPSSPRRTGTTATSYFPPTTWQCSNIHAGTGATNVIPGTLELKFNFRYSTASTREVAARAPRGDARSGTASTTSSRGPAPASRS